MSPWKIKVLGKSTQKLHNEFESHGFYYDQKLDWFYTANLSNDITRAFQAMKKCKSEQVDFVMFEVKHVNRFDNSIL